MRDRRVTDPTLKTGKKAKGPAELTDETRFSQKLKDWNNSGKGQTLGGMGKVFGDRTFAIIFMVMMATSALPIPTGGLTDVFAGVTVLVALQMIIGRKTLWLPKKWSKIKLNKTFKTKLIPGLIKIMERLERFSKPRMGILFSTRAGDILVGSIVALFAVATVLAPPFSGLDTLPAMGAVVVSAGILLTDGYIVILGTIIGAVGLLVQFAFGAAIVNFMKRLFGKG